MNNADMPAMAFVEPDHPGSIYPGLTKREQFAAMAMQGILANPSGHQEPEGAEPEMMLEIVAFASASFADALLAELDRTK